MSEIKLFFNIDFILQAAKFAFISCAKFFMVLWHSSKQGQTLMVSEGHKMKLVKWIICVNFFLMDSEHWVEKY